MTADLLQQAAALFHRGQFEEAERLCREQITGPDGGGFHLILGNILAHRGETDAALAQFAVAESMGISTDDSQNTQATLLIQAGRHSEAETRLRAILANTPDFHIARRNLARLLITADQPDAARQAAEPLISDPSESKNAENWNILARAQREGDAFGAAVKSYDQGLAIDPTNFDLRLGRAICWLDGGRAGEARREFEELVTVQPSNVELQFNLGLAVKRNGAADAALKIFDQVVESEPKNTHAIYNRGVTRLVLGDYFGGLADYEQRFSAIPRECEWRQFPGELWDGQSIDDGRLLIWQEQGIGDEVLYLGLLSEVTLRAKDITVECDRRLAPLFQRQFPLIKFVPKGEISNADAFDFQLPAASLMHALSPWPEGFRPQPRYLATDPEKVAAYAKDLLAKQDAPRIGVSWRSARRRIGPEKSLPLDQWRPILAAHDASFVNLQYGETLEEVAEASEQSGAIIYTHPTLDRFDDIDGLAALIDTLDLVITTSNITAHLAGALGKPCWLAAQQVPLWYWGAAGSGNVFYPSVRVFRQAQAGDWSDVVQLLSDALSQKLRQK